MSARNKLFYGSIKGFQECNDGILVSGLMLLSLMFTIFDIVEIETPANWAIFSIVILFFFS